VAILQLIRVADGPVTATALAAATGLHHTAVRQHLAVLTEAGLIVAIRLPHTGRGRPSTGYHPVDEVDGAVAYRELASLLAEAVRLGRSARAAGRDAGARVEPSEDGAVATLRAEAARLGFRPTVRDGTGGRHEIVLRECPFAELARRDPGTVCELHVGLAEGIADRSGAIEVEGIRLADPFRGGCRIVVRDADDRPPAT